MMTNNEMATNLFYDRLTGQTGGFPEKDATLMGRWILYPDNDSNLFLNSLSVEQAAFLVPDSSGAWSVFTGSVHSMEGTFVRQQLPEELEADSIRTIGERLASLMETGGTWLEWLGIIPLVPGMTDDVSILPFEQQIQACLGHLESVCQKPRAHLHVERMRVPISRSRRISSNASTYLASHTEDWHSRLIRGIMPKRILTEVPRDQIDIYENRVVARLLDHLLIYLNRRILKLKKLLKIFQDKEDYSSGATGGTYQRQQRIMTLWGDFGDANEGKHKVKSVLSKLEQLKYKLMGMMDSPLYRAVPHRTYVPTTLRTTNILSNDPHYRLIAELWREWSSIGADKQPPP